MALVFVAIELVVGVYDDTLFYDHMIQHLMLIMLAAPLIAMGAPVELLSPVHDRDRPPSSPGSLTPRVSGVVGSPDHRLSCSTPSSSRRCTSPASTTTMLTNDLAHDNEHLTFLVVGYLFWRPVVAIEPTGTRSPLHFASCT